ncbi:MAG TPA: SDR family oxidoreductase [Acidimicrobiales bacterium]|nr:SDR family oxidoreductase [Acidimicrobiales bacterium]
MAVEAAGRLAGKVAIVTGAAGGIGAACAAGLAAAGAAVVAADMDGAAAGRTAEGIVAAGGTAVGVEVDVADESSVAALHDTACRELGGVDILHNNAAATQLAGRDGLVGDVDRGDWDRAFAVNLTSMMLTTRQVVPTMVARGGGCIVNTSSGVTHGGQDRETAYAASKAGVEMLTRMTATQYGRAGIRCNAVSPGVIVHDGNRDLMPPDHLEVFRRHTLLPRLGHPGDIAAVVVFLASDDASFITGQVLTVDGGLHTAVTFNADLNDLGSGRP